MAPLLPWLCHVRTPYRKILSAGLWEFPPLHLAGWTPQCFASNQRRKGGRRRNSLPRTISVHLLFLLNFSGFSHRLKLFFDLLSQHRLEVGSRRVSTAPGEFHYWHHQSIHSSWLQNHRVYHLGPAPDCDGILQPLVRFRPRRWKSQQALQHGDTKSYLFPPGHTCYSQVQTADYLRSETNYGTCLRVPGKSESRNRTLTVLQFGTCQKSPHSKSFRWIFCPVGTCYFSPHRKLGRPRWGIMSVRSQGTLIWLELRIVTWSGKAPLDGCHPWCQVATRSCRPTQITDFRRLWHLWIHSPCRFDQYRHQKQLQASGSRSHSWKTEKISIWLW